MRGLFSRAAWRLWRRGRARRVRVHRDGGYTFEGVVWYRDKRHVHLLDAGLYSAEERLEAVGGEYGYVRVPVGPIIFEESA